MKLNERKHWFLNNLAGETIFINFHSGLCEEKKSLLVISQKYTKFVVFSS